MLDIEKVGRFCNQHKISVESLAIIHFIENVRTDSVRKEFIDYLKVMNDVKPDLLALTIANLIKDEFLLDYRSAKEIENKEYVISKLKLTDKFKNLLFVNEEDSYIRAKSLYPDMVYINNKSGAVRNSAKASASVKEEYYKRIFNERVLKNGNKAEFTRFCVILGEMFDPDNTGSPQKDAILGWDKFLLEWDTISRDFEKNMQGDTQWN